jgi:toxin ParE1/3/4
MTRPVILRARAERDVRDIFEWYEAQQSGLGAQFLADLRSTLEVLREFPASAPFIYKNVRRAIVSKFPYFVFYVDASTRVVVLAVLHSSRNPAIWPRR